jgi:hypothetical protein
MKQQILLLLLITIQNLYSNVGATTFTVTASSLASYTASVYSVSFTNAASVPNVDYVYCFFPIIYMPKPTSLVITTTSGFSTTHPEGDLFLTSGGDMWVVAIYNSISGSSTYSFTLTGITNGDMSTLSTGHYDGTYSMS